MFGPYTAQSLADILAPEGAWFDAESPLTGKVWREFGESSDLIASDFQANVNTTPQKVIFDVRRKADYQDLATFVRDVHVRLVVGGEVQSADQSAGAHWPTTEETARFEFSGSDLNGLTASQVNAADFGLALVVSLDDQQSITNVANVFDVQLTVE